MSLCCKGLTLNKQFSSVFVFDWSRFYLAVGFSFLIIGIIVGVTLESSLMSSSNAFDVWLVLLFFGCSFESNPLASRFDDLICSKNKCVGIVIGSLGCLKSIGVFTDDENERISSSFRWFVVGGAAATVKIGRKLSNEHVFKSFEKETKRTIRTFRFNKLLCHHSPNPYRNVVELSRCFHHRLDWFSTVVRVFSCSLSVQLTRKQQRRHLSSVFFFVLLIWTEQVVRYQQLTESFAVHYY